MMGSTLTMLVRSLREDSRLLRGHLLRFLLVVTMFGSLAAAHATSTNVSAPGLRFFTAIAGLNLIFIALAGISYFATAITEEKEEMTLGLLRMAGVHPVAILLGKSTSRLVIGLLLLSVQVPFTLLAITLGGLTPGQMVAAYSALAAYLLFVGNLALLFSVICQRSRSASWLTAIVLIALFLLPSWVNYSLQQAVLNTRLPPDSEFVQAAQAFLAWFTEASAFERVPVILSSAFVESPLSYQVVSNLTAAVLLFGLACLLFPLLTRNEGALATNSLLRRRFLLPRMQAGRASQHTALFWKDFYFLAGGPTLVIAKFPFYGLLIWGAYSSMELKAVQTAVNGSPVRELGSYAMGLMLIVMAIELTLCAGRVFREELQSRTWPTLTLLPLSVAEIAYAKAGGCLLALLPAATYFLLGCVLNPMGLVDALTTFPATVQWWLLAVQFLFFLHLAVFLSTIVKWGAVPLALTLVGLLNGCCVGPVVGAGAPTGVGMVIWGALSVLELGAVSFLHIRIGSRLESMAAH